MPARSASDLEPAARAFAAPTGRRKDKEKAMGIAPHRLGPCAGSADPDFPLRVTRHGVGVGHSGQSASSLAVALAPLKAPVALTLAVSGKLRLVSGPLISLAEVGK